MTPAQYILRFGAKALAVILIGMLIASAVRKLLGWG
jgi:hypothetical protein